MDTITSLLLATAIGAPVVVALLIGVAFLVRHFDSRAYARRFARDFAEIMFDVSSNRTSLWASPHTRSPMASRRFGAGRP